MLRDIVNTVYPNCMIRVISLLSEELFCLLEKGLFSVELVLEHETFGLVLKCQYHCRTNVYSLLGREVYGIQSSEKADLHVLYYVICTARKVAIFDNYSHLLLNWTVPPSLFLRDIFFK